MKNILIKTTISALSISLIMSNAFALRAAGFAGHASARHVNNARHFNRSDNAFANHGNSGNQNRFTNPSRHFTSTQRTGFAQQRQSITNTNTQNVTRTNRTIGQYTPQTMSVTGSTFVNHSVSYHTNTTIHKNTNVAVHSVQNTHVISNQSVLGPHAVQPIEVRHGSSPVVVNRGHSPVVVTGGQPWGWHSSPVIVRNPVIINSYPYHGGYGYYNGYYNDNNVNTFLAVALGVSLFANVAQLAAANNHTTNTVVYPAYYPVDTMSVAQPVPFVPYAPVSQSSGTGNTTAKSSQPVNVTINNTVNTTTTAPTSTTASDPAIVATAEAQPAAGEPPISPS